MPDKIKNIVVTVVMIAVVFGLAFFCWFKPADKFSDSERRPLDQFPSVTLQSIFAKNDANTETFMEAFESYTLDQFPLRDTFRRIKALFAFNVYNHSDNNNLYVEDGYVSKLEPVINEGSVNNAMDKFQAIYDKYLSQTDAKIYFSVIPDKGYFLAAPNGYLSMDYEKLFSMVKDKAGYADFISIIDALALTDYYKTDTHWKQEEIIDVAEKLAQSMGVSLSGEYVINTLDRPFYGVYHGQSALNLPADEIKYLTNDILNSFVVKVPNALGVGLTEAPLYNMTKAEGNDAYDMFLSGARVSLVTIENPNATSDKELIVFRDSYGSSLVPLLAEGYAKVTVIDLREITVPQLLSMNLVDFESADDILFIYSSLILNESGELK